MSQIWSLLTPFARGTHVTGPGTNEPGPRSALERRVEARRLAEVRNVMGQASGPGHRIYSSAATIAYRETCSARSRLLLKIQSLSS